MAFILHRGGDQRFVLQSAETGSLVGLLFPSVPGESRQSFAYNFGSTNDRQEILNIDQFPDLAEMGFFVIESVGQFEFERVFRSPDWAALRPLFGAAAKTIGYSARVDSQGLNPLSPLWQHTPPNLKGEWKIPAWGLVAQAAGVWLGNRDGLILAYNFQGEVINQYQLSKSNWSLAVGAETVYASCDDGQVYDLSRGKLPQAIYNARTTDRPIYYDFRIQALTVVEGAVLILDVYGNLSCLDLDWQLQWQERSGVWQGELLQADPEAIYVGHFRGVTCFDRQTGQIIWFQPTPAPVLCGVLLGDRLLVGTSDGNLYSLLKAGNLKTQPTELQLLATCAGPLYACAIAREGTWLIVTDAQATIYGFALAGEERTWRYTLDCGSILNLQVWGDRLYGATTNGTLACYDLTALISPASSKAPELAKPTVPQPTPVSEPLVIPTASKKRHRASKSSSSESPDSPKQMATTPTTEIWVECYQQGSQLKVKVISPGYQADWHVQFPRDLRRAGQRYRVDGLQESKQGGFYRVVGKIRPEPEA